MVLFYSDTAGAAGVEGDEKGREFGLALAGKVHYFVSAKLLLVF